MLSAAPGGRALRMQDPSSRRRNVYALRAAAREPADEGDGRPEASGRLSCHDVDGRLAVAVPQSQGLHRQLCR